MKSEIDTTFLLFLDQNLLTCTLYLKRNCLYICSVYKINEKTITASDSSSIKRVCKTLQEPHVVSLSMSRTLKPICLLLVDS